MKYLFTILFFLLFQFSSFSQECSYNQKYAGVKMADMEYTFTLMKPTQVSNCFNWYYISEPLPDDFDNSGVALNAYQVANCGSNNTLAYFEWVESGSQFLGSSFTPGGLVYKDVETSAIRANPGNSVYALTGNFPTIVSAPNVVDDDVLLMTVNYSNAQEVVNAMNSIHSTPDGQSSISFRHFEFFSEGINENALITFATGSSGSSDDLLDDPTDITHNEFDIVINTTDSNPKNFDWYNDGGTADSDQVNQGGLTLQGTFFVTHEMFHAVGLGHIRGDQVNDNDPNIMPIMSIDFDATAINTGYDDDDPCVINAVRCLHDDNPDTCDDLGSSTITLNIVKNDTEDCSVVLEWVSNVYIEDVIGYNVLKKDGTFVSSLNKELITPLAANDKHTFSLPIEYAEQEGFILEAVTATGMNSLYNF